MEGITEKHQASAQRQLDEATARQRQAIQGRPQAMQELTAPSVLPPRMLPAAQTDITSSIMPSLHADPMHQQALRELLNPTPNSYPGFTAQDPRVETLYQQWQVQQQNQGQQHLAQQQWQQQNVQQQAALHAQTQQALAQTELAEEQLLALRRAEYERFKQQNHAQIKSRSGEKTDLWKKLDRGEVFSDAEVKQLFHVLDLKKYGAKVEADKIEAEILRQYAENKLAENIVAHAERDDEGNVLLQGIPVRPGDAFYFAKQDIQHFQDTDLHLRPDQLMAANKTGIPSAQKQESPRVRLLYVDAAGMSSNPVKYAGRAFGHTVLEVDGKVYNFTPAEGLSIIPAEQFINNVRDKSTRSTPPQNVYAFPVEMTADEVKVLKQELSKDPGKYDPLNNSCATYTIQALEKATGKSKAPIKGDPYAAGRILSGDAFSPSDVIDSTRKSKRITKDPKIYNIYESDRPEVNYRIWPWNWGLK